MTDDDGIVPIDNDVWHHCGCRIIRWIDRSITEDCYKLRFGKPGGPVSIVFVDADYAMFFRFVVCSVIGDQDRLLDTIE